MATDLNITMKNMTLVQVVNGHEELNEPLTEFLKKVLFQGQLEYNLGCES